MLLVTVVFSKLGFDTAIVKLIATYFSINKKELIPKLYKRIVFWVVIASGIATVLLVLNSKWMSRVFFEDGYHNSHVLIISLAVIPLSLLHINAEVFKASKNITLFSFFQNGTIFFLSLIIIMISYPLYSDIKLVLLSVIFSIVILLGLSLYFIQGQMAFPIKHIRSKIKSLIIKTESTTQLFKLSLPMLLSNSLFLILNWTDIIMLGLFKGEAEVGVYNIALKIAVLNAIILVGVNSIAMPKYAELFAKKEMNKLKIFVKQTTILVILLSLPIFLFILVFPEFLLGLFGNEFLIGTQALLILTIGQAFSAFSSSSVSLLNMTGKEISARNILIISVIFNMILNYVLIPIYGINGAAMATSTSTILWNVLAVIVLYRNFNFTTYPINVGMFGKK
jgi:O-antigen/teichoic acid export membrane protein